MKVGVSWCRQALVLASLLAVGACAESEPERARPTPEAGFIVVSTQPVELTTELGGRTAAFETSEVRPQVSGVIRSRQFTEGSLVRAGQTLYQIDSSVYQASASEAQANLASAEAARNAAAAREARFRPLARLQAISQQEYTDATATARQATASVAQSRAQVEAARINLRFTRVPAPITGRIGRSLVTTGGLVTANQAEALTTIQRLDPMFVDIQQSSADLLALRQKAGTSGNSATVRLKLEDGSTYGYTGTLQFAEAMVDPGTGSVTLRARFPNPQGLLLPGMYVRASLVQQSVPNGIMVPQTGVSRDPQGNATVMVIGPNNTAIRKKVTADRTIGDQWLVTAGLNPGEKVIVEGLGKIRPNAKIVPVAAGSKPKPRPAGSGAGEGRAAPAA